MSSTLYILSTRIIILRSGLIKYTLHYMQVLISALKIKKI